MAEALTNWTATNERGMDGSRIKLHLSAEDAEFAWATLPIDAQGEYVRVAEEPSVIVTDTVTGKLYRVRRKSCGIGCMCDLSAVELDEKSTVAARKTLAAERKTRETERKNYLNLAEGLGLKIEWLDLSLIDHGHWFNSCIFSPDFKIVGLQRKDSRVCIRSASKEYRLSAADAKNVVETSIATSAKNRAAAKAREASEKAVAK